MDAMSFLWMYYSWLQDLEDENDFARSYAILTGSFSNPEMAKRMVKMENPDHESSDEDFEKLSQDIVNRNKARPKIKKRRKKILSQDNK